MIEAKYPPAEIKDNGNVFAIEYYKTYEEEVKRGNPYNTDFYIRVVSGSFRGYAPCECDVKGFVQFVKKLEELYFFKRKKVVLQDYCYGSEVTFQCDRVGHVEIAGEIFGTARIQSLTFCFQTDQTSLLKFIQTLKLYIADFA